MAEEGKTHSGCTAVTAFLRLEDQQGRQLFLDSAPSETTAVEEETPPPSTTSTESDSKMSRMRNAMKSLTGRKVVDGEEKEPPIEPPQGLRKVLYTANAGDARAVLCRSGKGVRLTYDHKGSDKQEAKRIKEAGGFVMNNRVNGQSPLSCLLEIF